MSLCCVSAPSSVGGSRCQARCHQVVGSVAVGGGMVLITPDGGRPRLTWRLRPGRATIAAVISPVAPAVVHAVPVGAVYSLLLLAHVACAVVGFGALAVT